MARFTAKDVQALRQATGAGMMDAKRALEACDGDQERAKDWLREKNLAQSHKRADRENTQGAVAVTQDGDAAAMVELRCETDFVAKSPEFTALADELAALVLAKGEEATAERMDDVDRLKATLKENIAVGRVVRYERAADSVLDVYLHVQNGRGVNAVLVELARGKVELAHEIALHIAFTRPRFLRREEVPPAEVEAERRVLEAQTRNEGKPDAAVPKIVEGKLNGFFASHCLLEQKYVKDPKLTIQQLLGRAAVTRFAQVEIGK